MFTVVICVFQFIVLRCFLIGQSKTKVFNKKNLFAFFFAVFFYYVCSSIIKL
ncbi:hypothetical protein lotta81_gp006 [Flavobacterium phage vB_FspM_lotta8-1]|uniref:Uncharacterized protein n=3 Tax=Pippivirus TaxID=2843435 RepID=A0A6B9LKC9_9CAUD|nr:hypothetical protein HWC85_gp06 [Flavobacterium phage vB_FspM_lotta8-1]YP_009854537.1 hypothetical protein HWC86_gp06 [Flavobacterium phage vB_FspM_pippi8-1]QHB38464.1 hypothetical protein lotta81_gp006 [Flavobacterium phage vB_FspM_lotta8-1]QHB38517.1 hypothetical protein lotta82_gp006 [Flavobacterium phage vB_FspM_lotta8-2]QHB38570.1 hypothetical protein pippi81_gp006 [Flavobacterium phage vB_FspM_pippi8-1]